MQGMAMPVAHRLSQSGQWQQLQSQWEQQQQQLQLQQQQQHNHHQPHTPHDPYYHQHQHQPYDDYYHNDPTHHPAYSPYPPPPHQAAPPIPPLLLRIAVSPTQTEDLPIDVTADTDVSAIAQHFCQSHNITGDSKLQKLQAMIERSVEQHRQQHTPVQPADYYAPYPADGQYEQGYGGGYYDEQQAYAEQYGGQYAMQQPMAATPSPQPSQSSVSESDDLSPLQPTFTPSRPTSAMSHTSHMQHSRHESNTPSTQHSFSHSQPTPSLRPSSLTLPTSSSPSPRSTSLRPISPHTAGYLNAPASARLYANAAVKQRQLARHQQQKQAMDDERTQQELQHCTFTPQLTNPSNSRNRASHSQQHSSERRKGRKQYEWIEDWNGEKRERRLERMRETEKKRLKDEECSFTPTVNAVSHQLVQLNKANPTNKTKSKDNKQQQQQQDDKQDKAANSRRLDAAAKAKITQFLNRTIERQQAQKQALLRLQADNVKQSTPSFVPAITIRAQSAQSSYNKPTSATEGSGGSGGSGAAAVVVAASVKKRQRRCEEIYRCWADSDGYIDRSGWMALVKSWYMRDGSGSGSGSGGSSRRLESMRWELETDDVAVIQMVIRECDRQVRRDRKAANVSSGVSESDEFTWQLSLADFQLWMERGVRWVLDRAQTAEREEGRMIQKFTPVPDP